MFLSESCWIQVLLLNGSHDRETAGLSASGFVTAITDSLNRTYGDPHKSLKNRVSLFYVPLKIYWKNMKLWKSQILQFWEYRCHFSAKIHCWLFLCLCVQPNDYVNAILVPEGGQVPLDIANLAAQGIFNVVSISILLAMIVLIDVKEDEEMFLFSLLFPLSCISTTSHNSELFS